MASDQQQAQQNLESFEIWRATQADDDYKQISYRCQLNRTEVAKGIGLVHTTPSATTRRFGTSATWRLRVIIKSFNNSN